MGIADRHDRVQGTVRLAMVLSAGLVVAGCTGGSLPSLGGSLPNWFAQGSKPTAPGQAAPQGVSLEDDCPPVDIRTGAGTLAIAAKAQQPTANDLRYQFTFVEMARQCFVDSGNLRMRVGVLGRAVVGPAGAPPEVVAPIRYAVVQEGVTPKTITTKVRRVPVALGSGNVTFTDIEEDLSFPLPPPAVLQSYVVYVGFDEAGEQPQRSSPKKKAPKKLDRSVAPELR
ncbi:MAG: hypothetical protein IT536_16585 [Hyphomicrobiales bacterium]|nr:hypothetical protein [Hyphomicrobiales bacterium]